MCTAFCACMSTCILHGLYSYKLQTVYTLHYSLIFDFTGGVSTGWSTSKSAN